MKPHLIFLNLFIAFVSALSVQADERPKPKVKLVITDLQPRTKALLSGTGSPTARRTKSKVIISALTIKARKARHSGVDLNEQVGGRTFTTSTGHIGDFAVPQLVRVIFNEVFRGSRQGLPKEETAVRKFTPEKAKQAQAK